MTPLAQRCLAFLEGIDEERPTRARIAAAVNRSERSVIRAIKELVENLWITCGHSGNGLPAKITVIKHLSEILAPEQKMAPEWHLNEAKMAPESSQYSYKILKQEQNQEASRPARKPQSVQIPPEFITTPGGRTMLNPAWVRVRDAVRGARERIERSRDPEAYMRTIIEREAATR